MNSPFELPSLEEIQEMDRQRLQAIEALQISNDCVMCQKCGNSVPLLRTSTSTSTKSSSIRIDTLQKRVKWIEDHSHGNNANANIKQPKAELADLLEEEAKADALRRLPLYSCKITG